MSNFIQNIRTTWKTARKAWLFSSFIAVALIAIPLLVILAEFLTPGSGENGMFSGIRSEYLTNSLWLILGVGGLAAFFGVSSAWVVANYDFRGRKFFDWALILPLTIPSYIIAFTYQGIFEHTGPVQATLRNWFGTETAASLQVDVMTMGWLMVLLAAVLFPYVYVSSRAAFMLQTTNYLEAGRSLGLNRTQSFFRIALPLARPAIIGGVFLVVMEVLNDYGAMDYFGINTFTTGIFRAWLGKGDLESAVSLAAILLVFVFILISLERWQRGRAHYHGSSRPRPLRRTPLKGRKAVLAFAVCSLPFAIGFFIPILQLVAWGIETASERLNWNFAVITWNTVLLALMAVSIIISVALLIAYTRKLNKGKLGSILSRLAVIGYTVPGAIIAIGVMIPALALNNSIVDWINSNFNPDLRFAITQTVIILLFAYAVRFLAVAYNPIEAGFEKSGKHLDEASLSLGIKPFKALRKVHFPLLKPALIGAALLTFVDVLKELPLTFILRPSNFNTLATEAYDVAKEEQVADAAWPALVIILVGIIPIFLLHKTLLKQS